MDPPPKTELPPEKKLTHHPLKNLEHPDKKLKSLGIILILWETLNSLKVTSCPTPMRKSEFLRNLNPL